jgi:hypothetical protein
MRLCVNAKLSDGMGNTFEAVIGPDTFVLFNVRDLRALRDVRSIDWAPGFTEAEKLTDDMTSEKATISTVGRNSWDSHPKL